MTLKLRLIPKLQMGIRQSYQGPQPILMVTSQFEKRRPIGDPLSQAKIYEAQLADELILINIERSSESWPIYLKTLEKISVQLATPLTVGGGISNFEQVQALLDRGADKVMLNSTAHEYPNLINKVANMYGSQCLIIGLDTKPHSGTDWRVWTHGGLKDSGIDAEKWASEAVDRGAGEILVTSIERDGTGRGLDLELIQCLSEKLSIPIIASGGCGLAEHFVEGYQAGAAAVAAGTFFSKRDQNPMQCRSHIRNAGLEIRIGI